MPPIIDPQSQLVMGNPEGFSSLLTNCPSQNEINIFIEQMILSASGWRNIFAASGIEEDPTQEISSVATLVSGIMVKSFVTFLEQELSKSPDKISVIVGIDSRPTGPALADPMLRVLLGMGVKVEYLFIVAGPEIMAYVQQSNTVDGFVYISASHNPIGHNGVKFGLCDGGVLGGQKATKLIQLFKQHIDNPSIHQSVYKMITLSDTTKLEHLFANQPRFKSRSYESYIEFTKRVVTDAPNPQIIDFRIQELKTGVEQTPLGILLEMNGSARSTSIDIRFLETLGIKIKTLNAKPREIVHRIVPEGRSLQLCKEELFKLHSNDPIFQIGMVPDCDGDRGNLVFFDPNIKQVREVEAQELFGLLVLSELAWLVYTKQLTYSEHGTAEQHVAVVVNDPTSGRIDHIAKLFGAKVFRAEVGEANVVNLAEEKRSEGWIVRILGEGSNGGNITYPSKVRDPLNTIVSIAKLLCLKEIKTITAQKLSINIESLQTLTDYLAVLPTYITTSAYEDRAIMKVATRDHRILKEQFEQVFLREWQTKKFWLSETYGIINWREINYEGTVTKIGFGSVFRSGSQRGGLKIELLNDQDEPVAYLWMRGSGTEPVFRIIVDVKGNYPQLEETLLNWLRTMIEEADC
jgi:phosphoglucomutase